MKKITYIYFFVLLISAGCRKFLEIDKPINVVSANYAYNSENSAIAVVSGIYYGIQQSYAQGDRGISISCAAASDEVEALDFDGGAVNSAYLNNFGEDYWSRLYQDVYKCNAAIEGLEKSEKLSYIVQGQLLGETKFTRAFLYFYLVNFFGDIPLVLTTNYAENAKLFRSAKAKVYEQIKTDLEEAILLLNTNYVAGDARTISIEKVRPNKAAAQALLARVYLYMGRWAEAEAAASLLIDNPVYEISSDLDAVFLKNSKEAIWQLQSENWTRGATFMNTLDAAFMVLDDRPNGDLRPLWISTHLEGIFEPGDLRYDKWVGKTDFRDAQNVPDEKQYRYAYKYKLNKKVDPQQEYLMVLRIGEQYLIRAEARINNGNIAGGIEDLNLLRSKRSIGAFGAQEGLAKLSTGLNPEQAKLAVEHERRVELFTEWGHRWLDLKRTGKIDQVMSALNPAKSQFWAWLSFMQLFRTPQSDRLLNPNLGQTPGYAE